MATDSVRCVLVKIHGIGQQPEDWSKDFDTALAAQLTAGEQALLAQQSVWWAPLSRLPGLPTASLGPGVRANNTATSTTNQAFVDYSHYLATSGAGAPGAGDATAGHPADVGSVVGGLANQVIKIGNQQIAMADHVTDVANYIGNNRIRLAIQECLSTALLQMQQAHPSATMILASHSQGTIIAYDMLRLFAARVPTLKIWVSMGCPLAWYLNGASWGSNEIEMSAIRQWVNLYDPQDAVGQDLDRLTSWSPIVPEDINVDNVAHSLHPHDHWNNPVVVAKYVELIRAALA
jgi:hypothetical protein